MSGMERLQTLLFDQGRELVNLKFLPGTDRNLSPDEFAGVVCDVLNEVFARGEFVDNPPVTGLKKRHISEVLQGL